MKKLNLRTLQLSAVLATALVAATPSASADSRKRTLAPRSSAAVKHDHSRWSPQSDPEVYTARMRGTPDVNQHMTWAQLMQQLPASEHRRFPPSEFPRVFKSKSYCGPCTIANNLVWLDGNGFPSITKTRNRLAAGVELAFEAGKLTNGGTSYPDFVNATVKMLRSRGIEPRKVSIISSIDRRDKTYKVGGKASFHYSVRAPRPADIKAAVRKHAVVGMIYGHYRPGSASVKLKKGDSRPWTTGTMFRTGGHWVTPVGYGLGADGGKSRDTIIIRDSAGGRRLQEKQAWKYLDWEKVGLGSKRKCYMARLRGKDNEKRGVLNGHYALSPLPDGRYTEGDSDKLEVLEGLVVIEVDPRSGR